MSENTLAIERTPEVIATEILSIKEQTKKILLMSSIEIGMRLTEAKELVPHGEWGKWLEDKVDYSQRTANNFMRVYKEYGGSQMTLYGGTVDSQAIANLSYTQAIELLSIPSYEREQFVEENNVQGMSTRELQQAIKERDEAKKKLKEAEETAEQAAWERDELKGEMDKLSGDLKKAQESGASEEQVKKLEDELKAARDKVKILEEEASKPVTVEPAVIEKVPDEIEREINALREQVKQFKDKAGQPLALVKFKVQFDTVVGGFSQLLNILEDIKESQPGEYEKYHGAVTGLLNRMLERL